MKKQLLNLTLFFKKHSFRNLNFINMFVNVLSCIINLQRTNIQLNLTMQF